MKKMPPIQKILEAYTAIVDKHVELKNNEALVTSLKCLIIVRHKI